ncbi:DNA-binding transcriptional LysR family regulator [Pseudorhodoferax soli]|uniref:DNA-binding transcriptional LysR family regulator n=2 Tax=Pseudorhodoferax soli TaxID=545864 RepID=A0A368XXX0_9BURK|nr:DNA-binding transcriptional LysR family regulator [Pseudorhodoferax soli]
MSVAAAHHAPMDRLKALEIFAAVAERNSFTRAAASLDLSTPVVTRAVQELEQSLGLRLLQRSTRRVALTREGEAALARARGVIGAYEALMQSSRQHGAEVAGDIRFSAPASFGAARLAPLLADFMAQHPQVRIDLVLGDALESMEDGAVDLALRIAQVLPEHLVARRIGEVPMGMYAAPAYLRARGLPREPGELAGHDCVVHSGPGASRAWQFSHPVTQERTQPVLRQALRANHVEALMAAALLGQGLAMLPRMLADPAVERGELQPVLAAWACPAPGIFLVYRERQHQPLRVRKLIEHVAQAFESGGGWPLRLRAPERVQATALLH